MSAYLHQAIRDAHILELRHLHDGESECGTFTTMDRLRAEIHERAAVGNLYVALNRPAPTVRPPNRMGRHGLHDTDIERIVRLPFDIDPVRPRDSASTADELAAAVAQRDRFVAAQHAIGWAMPSLGVSGNGAHAVYRCLLPASERPREALRTI